MLNYIHCSEGCTLVPDRYASSDKVYYVCPSFIDLQVNGYAGVSLDADEGVTVSKLEHMSRELRASGCAVFVPTLITSPYARLRASLEETRLFMKKNM